MKKVTLVMVVLVFSAWMPTFGQATDDCVGQPTVGNVQGSTGLSLDPLAPAAIGFNTFAPTGGVCVDVAGLDSVVCFTVENACTPTFTYTSGGSQSVSMNVIAGSCSTVPGPCAVGTADTASNGAAVTVNTVLLGAGTTVCVYFSGNNSEASLFELTNATACGALPVEIQRFVVE